MFDPFDMGYKACDNVLSFTANPFPFDSNEYKLWIDGYTVALSNRNFIEDIKKNIESKNKVNSVFISFWFILISLIFYMFFYKLLTM